MIPNLYIGNGCFTKHLFINGCLGFQVGVDPGLEVWSFSGSKWCGPSQVLSSGDTSGPKVSPSLVDPGKKTAGILSIEILVV